MCVCMLFRFTFTVVFLFNLLLCVCQWSWTTDAVAHQSTIRHSHNKNDFHSLKNIKSWRKNQSKQDETGYSIERCDPLKWSVTVKLMASMAFEIIVIFFLYCLLDRKQVAVGSFIQFAYRMYICKHISIVDRSRDARFCAFMTSWAVDMTRLERARTHTDVLPNYKNWFFIPDSTLCVLRFCSPFAYYWL